LAEISTIGFVIPSLTSGGAERVVAVLAEALAKDFSVHVLVEEGAAQHYAVKGVTVHGINFTTEGILAAVGRLQLDLLMDHYHWDQDHVRVMAEVADAGVPVVLTEHNAYHYPLFQWARDVKDGYENWFDERYAFYRKFAAVTVLNEEAFRFFSQHLNNVRKVQNPAPNLASRRADLGSRRILTVSHFRKRAKRLDLMYQMFGKVSSRVPDASLTILGDYDWVQDHYCRKAAGPGEFQIETPGRTSLVDRYYDRAALFALTSEIEGQPMVLLEAALHGIPQVAFDLPGLRDQIVHGETGLLVPFGDTDAFADAVVGLIGDERRLAEMGGAGRALMLKEFSIDRVAGLWRELIAEIATKGRITSKKAKLPGGTVLRDAEWRGFWQNAARRGDPSLVPKISFLVPVYGTEEVLGRCLRSIQSQTLTEFECIVVDDASPGNVQEVVKSTVGDDARFRVIEHSRNRGLYQARSTAADAARGLYFAHVDSDDYIHPEFARVMFTEAITTGSEIVECEAVELREDGRPIRFNEVKKDGPVDGDQAAQAFFNNSLRNVVWNKIYARDLWRRVPEHASIDVGLSICEDLLRNSFLFPECRRYSSVADCMYFYCRRPDSVVKGGDLARLLVKLKEVEVSYGIAKSRQGAPDQAVYWRKLDDRRIEDVQWYIAEYLERHDFAGVQEELRQMGDKIDPMVSVAMTMVKKRSELKADNARMAKLQKFEQNRAIHLEMRLTELRQMFEK
jgi:glycosyltransferase involved in cell wall biosynthesis